MNQKNLAQRCFQFALLLAIIGVVLGAIAVYAERRAVASAAWHDPSRSIRPAAIAPDLALLSLAGISDDRILTLATEQSELETVYALLALSIDLTDQQRMNGWLWLGHRYQSTHQNQRAAQAYRLAGQGALLSARLPDLLRVETLLTVGQQLTALHDGTNARHFLQQAALIAAHAPQITAHDRSILLEQLVPALLRTGGQRNDWAALSKVVEHDAPHGHSVNVSAAHYGVSSAWGSRGLTADLVRARDDRQKAAAALLAVITAKQDAKGPREALRQALLAEEQTFADFWSRQHKDPLDINLAAHETRLRWLSLKRQVAAGALGDALLPQWTSDLAQIEAELSTAWVEWLGLTPTGGAQKNNVSAARWALMAAYWGLYPDAPVSDLLAAIQKTTQNDRLHLATFGSNTLAVLGWTDKDK